MKLLQLFKCLVGKHVRSRGQAREDGAVIRSRCRGCGKPMIRTFSGWSMEPRATAQDDHTPSG